MLAVACTIATGCGDEAATSPHPTIGGEPVDPRIVEHVARRDGLSPEAAREKVVNTLRLAADAAASGTDPLSTARREHLVRSARARLVVDEVFVAEHGVDAIPADHPRLARARGEKRFDHPPLHVVCQLIVAPPGEPSSPEVSTIAANPAWQARAMTWMTDVRDHVAATVPLADPEACEILMRVIDLERAGETADLTIRGEAAGGFDLDACLVERGADGSCAQPQFASEWVAPVREGPVPGLRGPFVTRFGVHLVLVRELLPAASPTDPDFDARVRAAVHPVWQAEEFAAWLGSLRTRHAALVASAP